MAAEVLPLRGHEAGGGRGGEAGGGVGGEPCLPMLKQRGGHAAERAHALCAHTLQLHIGRADLLPQLIRRVPPGEG